MKRRLLKSLLIVALGLTGFELSRLTHLDPSEGVPVDLFLTALIGLTSLVGTVVIAAALAIFGPGLLNRFICWVRGHRFRPTAFGFAGRCTRCGEER